MNESGGQLFIAVELIIFPMSQYSGFNNEHVREWEVQFDTTDLLILHDNFN